jgi:hypothetical protein
MPGIFLKDEKDRSDLPVRYEPSSEPCPTSVFSGYLKQTNRAELSDVEAGFLSAAFRGFLTGVTPPGAVSALLAETLQVSVDSVYENRISRRYDGDKTLPPGRYSTVCQDSTGNDGGTLVREMRFYFDPKTTEGHIDILDSTLPDHIPQLKHTGTAIDPDEPRVTLRYFPYASCYGEPGISLPFSVSLIVKKVDIEGVLDLRRPAAANWLARAISKLTWLDAKGTRVRAFVNRPDLTDFSQVIYSLLDQAKGGGNFHKIVGLYLRQVGVSGLVFPSVRGNVGVEFDEDVKSYSGWSFIDFRNAPPPYILAFCELRPQWPTHFVNEGGDDNTPSAPAFSDQIKISLEGYESGRGHLSAIGLEARSQAFYWFASASAAVRYRLSRATDADIEYLRLFVVSLDAQQAANFSAMVLFSILGNPEARANLEQALQGPLRGHPLTPLLQACLTPPPPTSEQKGSFERFLVKALSGGKSVPEPAT